MNAKANAADHPLPDVQNQSDDRGVAIDQVGVTDLKFPITVLDRRAKRQSTVASLTLSVGLPHHFKGTHMSRFVEVLNAHRGEFTMRTLPEILAELRARLHAASARIALTFPYFLERTAPVSGATALMDYECTFVGLGHGNADHDDFAMVVRVPVASLCPCSKEISDYGAHNQRGSVEMEVRTAQSPGGRPALVWIEELVEIAERSASAPVYPLLKRPDERHVTMQAYDNPVFVEDLARNVAVSLKGDGRIATFRVRVVNHESIHNHNAFAEVSWSRGPRPNAQ